MPSLNAHQKMTIPPNNHIIRHSVILVAVEELSEVVSQCHCRFLS